VNGGDNMITMTEQEAHDKVRAWMRLEKDEVTLTEMDNHHFGKVELHKVICEIYGAGDVKRLALQLAKNRNEITRMKDNLKQPKFTDAQGYYTAFINRLEESNKEIVKAIGETI
jgi:uncharacterized protein (DUF305 family)